MKQPGASYWIHYIPGNKCVKMYFYFIFLTHSLPKSSFHVFFLKAFPAKNVFSRLFFFFHIRAISEHPFDVDTVWHDQRLKKAFENGFDNCQLPSKSCWPFHFKGFFEPLITRGSYSRFKQAYCDESGKMKKWSICSGFFFTFFFISCAAPWMVNQSIVLEKNILWLLEKNIDLHVKWWWQFGHSNIN